MPAPGVELFSIGNEILQGDILDTNANWLCRQLATRGARVSRMTVLPDDEQTIGEALHAALQRRPALLITCGGLGPTVDDLTLVALSRALGRSLDVNAEALRMVAGFYAGLFHRGQVKEPDVTPVRRKMALLPAGSTPLANSVGAAPGVLLVEAGVQIASLPGVPQEMKAIFAESLWPLMAAQFERQTFAERTIPTDCHDESVMSAAVDAVTTRHPSVYVKSRAQVYGGEAANFVTLSARATDQTEAARLLDVAEADLRQALAQAGINTGPAQTLQ